MSSEREERPDWRVRVLAVVLGGLGLLSGASSVQMFIGAALVGRGAASTDLDEGGRALFMAFSGVTLLVFAGGFFFLVYKLLPYLRGERRLRL